MCVFRAPCLFYAMLIHRTISSVSFALSFVQEFVVACQDATFRQQNVVDARLALITSMIAGDIVLPRVPVATQSDRLACVLHFKYATITTFESG